MKLTHVYRLRPTTDQVTVMEKWLELLRRHYNYSLGQRLDWLRRTRCQIDRCSLVSEAIGEIPERVNYYTQSVALKDNDAPKFYRRTQAHLARQQRFLACQTKGSKNSQKQANKIARIHQKIARQRQDVHYNVAHKLNKEFK